MLFFVGTGFHAYTLDALQRTECGGHGVWTAAVSYDDLFDAALLPSGTYLFTDIERLSSHERLLAAAIYRAMGAHPDTFRPINNPARVRVRFSLLRALHEAGLNEFDAYRASGLPRPQRFPVFIKSESNHDAAVTGLLADQVALDAALAELEGEGIPLDSLLVIEFSGEPALPGVWVRYTAFRVGDDVLLDLPVTEAHWAVKYGEIGLVGDDRYWLDDAMVRNNHHAGVLRRAFDLARIEYGRLDFGLVGGRPQIYEINTNPNVPGLEPLHPSVVRQASRVFTWKRLTARLAALAAASPAGEGMALDVPLVTDYRGRSVGARMGWRP